MDNEYKWQWGITPNPETHASGSRYLCCGYDGFMKPFESGDWVPYADYETLKQECQKTHQERVHDLNQIGGLQEENARLKAELSDEKSANANVEGRQNSVNRALSMQNFKLKAENERLRKISQDLYVTGDFTLDKDDKDFIFQRNEYKEGNKEFKEKVHMVYIEDGTGGGCLREPRQSDGWLPIETAPKDGQTILGWSNDYTEPTRFLWACLHQWNDPNDVFGWVEVDGDWSTSAKVTHWMPLPHPPKN